MPIDDRFLGVGPESPTFGKICPARPGLEEDKLALLRPGQRRVDRGGEWIDRARPALVPDPQGRGTLTAEVTLAAATSGAIDARLPLHFQRIGVAHDVDGIAAPARGLAADRAVAPHVWVGSVRVERKPHRAAMAGSSEPHPITIPRTQGGHVALVPLIEYAQASAEVRAVYDDIMKTRGVDWINNFWKALANDPNELARVWRNVKQVMAPGALDPLVKEMVYVAVSATNGCEYCTYSHTAAARKRGMTDAMLMELLAVVGLANETNRLANGLRVDADRQFKP